MKKLFIIMGLLAVLALAACETRIVMPEQDQANALNVQGRTEFDVSPDEAVVRIRVETQKETANDAQDENRRIANAVISALKAKGLRSDEIETAEYNVQKVREWDYERKTQVDKGYRVYNVLKVTTDKLDKVGDVIDGAVNAGANNIDSVDFQLSEKKMSEVKTEALKKAAANAKEKAQALADGMGISLGKLKSISEGYVSYAPMARYDVMEMAAGGMDEAPTPIAPEAVQISAEVSVSYEIA